jgi:hypothetical protein
MLAPRPTGIPLAQNVWPLKAAMYRSDSASVSVEVAEVDLSASPGDTLALIAAGDDAVFAQAGPDVRLQVIVDGVAHAYSLDELRAGVTVQRWNAAGPSHVSYRLSRGVATVAEGTFRLEQRSNAQVAAARTPWVRTATTGASLAVASSGECTLDAASGTCDGVTYTISPFQPGVAFPAWQNAPGTGQSAPITVAFSDPVASVTITIEDPTYAGNSMTAYAADGSVVGTAQFSFSGQPGTNIPDTKTITGKISQVVLTPPTGDYVTYHGSFSTGKLTLACDKVRVQRGNPITCTARRGDQPVDVKGWRFNGRLNSLPGFVYNRADGNPTDSVWSGPFVADGLITVTATDNDTANQVVLVDPRPWGTDSTKLPRPATTHRGSGPVTGALRPLKDPIEGGLIGLTVAYTAWGRDLSIPSYFEKIEYGPNTGVTYATSAPGPLVIETSVNFDALREGSVTWNWADRSLTPTFCTPSQVVGELQRAMKHEGYTVGNIEGPIANDTSHVRTVYTGMLVTYLPRIERMIADGYPKIDALIAVKLQAEADAAILSIGATHVSTFTPPPCLIRDFKP